MQRILAGFVDELTKTAMGDKALLRQALAGKDDPTAKDIVTGTIHNQTRNYLKTMLLGAAVAPAMTLIARGLGRYVHNRNVRAALGVAVGRKSKTALRAQLKQGPIFGRSLGQAPNLAPMITHADLASDVAIGAIGGSVVQALRDRMLNR